ncbi:hypothetical protein [Streptomyces sp. NPDC047061]|uniref:Pepco domain-containing protein n=1 Tax=Streptomyces sp. NPDC047061 TaxID=3154605 RepID=UPI0033ED63AA
MHTTESSSAEAALDFWVSSEEHGEDPGDSMGLFNGNGDTVLRRIPLGPLRKNLADAVDALQQIFADVAARGGQLPLREAHLSFQVTANGGVQFIGTTQMQSSRGIVLVFKE